jgi:hypothetical protein
LMNRQIDELTDWLQSFIPFTICQSINLSIRQYMI